MIGRAVSRAARFAAPALSVLAGCASAPIVDCPGDGDAPPSLRQPLNGAVGSPEYLGLAPEEIAAIVHLRIYDGELGTSTCTGTFVTSGWILSAAHCVPPSAYEVQVNRVDQQGTALRLWTVEQVVTHPTLDLALLAVPSEEQDFVPIAAANSLASGLRGQRAQQAGTGRSESAEPGSLSFAVTTIAAVSEAELVVDADGYSGACDGDSGGPLLLRGADGLPQVAGVLSRGNASCFSTDTYVRTDAARDWIQSIAGEAEAAPALCGELDEQGRCFGDVAAHCASGELRGERCEGSERCGWSDAERGFRCVNASSDPCDGVDALGACRDGDAYSCEAGRLRRNTCSQCGASCVISPKSAKAQCVF